MPRVSKPTNKQVVKKQRPATVKGRGEYTYSNPGPWGQTGRTWGARAAEAIATPYGIPRALSSAVGAKVGGLAHYIGKIFGSGDYSFGEAPVMNSLFKGAATRTGPNSVTFGEKSVRIKHREYLCDVTTGAAGTFRTQNFNINPGVINTFPWLSNIAASFESYIMHGCVVEFKSTSCESLNSTNTALGSIILASDNNSATINEDFLNKQEMLQYAGAINCKPSQSMLMGIECDPKKISVSQLYVRNGAIKQGYDPRLYDLCSFAIASAGFQASYVNVGELFIAYDIELINSVQLAPASTNLAADYQIGAYSITQAAGATQGILGHVNFADYTLPNKKYDNIGLVMLNSAATANCMICVKDRSVLQSGMKFEVTIVSKGASTSNISCPNVTTPNGTTCTDYKFSPDALTTASSYIMSYELVVDNISNLGGYGSDANFMRMYPNHAVLAAITTSGVSGATSTFNSPYFCQLIVKQINPQI